MWRGNPLGREVPEDRDRDQDQDREDKQARWPPAGPTVVALNQQIIHDQHCPVLLTISADTFTLTWTPDHVNGRTAGSASTLGSRSCDPAPTHDPDPAAERGRGDADVAGSEAAEAVCRSNARPAQMANAAEGEGERGQSRDRPRHGVLLGHGEHGSLGFCGQSR
jgi:hypothetical protein